MNIMKQPNKENSILLVWSGGIYVLTIAIVIISSWLSKLYLFNLSLTVSLYVGLRQWTSVIYLILFLCVDYLSDNITCINDYFCTK